MQEETKQAPPGPAAPSQPSSGAAPAFHFTIQGGAATAQAFPGFTFQPGATVQPGSNNYGVFTGQPSPSTASSSQSK
jgi:hypothetical protein